MKYVHVRNGYCRECRRNVRHVVEYRFRFLPKLRWQIARLFLRFRYGHWHCTICGTPCGRLVRPRADAVTWEPSGRKRGPQPRGPAGPSSADNTAAQPVGNFLLQERSLAAKQERTYPYTDKFRESVILRLLQGQMTIRETRDQLHLSEADLLAWFDDCLQQKQSRIDELTALLTALQRSGLLKLESDFEVLPPTPDR